VILVLMVVSLSVVRGFASYGMIVIG
jgi:hypothetical protein